MRTLLLLVSTLAVPVVIVACQPPRVPAAESGDATVAAVTPTATASAAPTAAPTGTTTAAPTATAPTAPSSTPRPLPSTFPMPAPSISGFPFPFPIAGTPTLPASPRAALIGVWKIAGVDGKAVATAPGMATDPLDPATYIAGSTVTFTDAVVSTARGGLTVSSRPYKVLSELPPVRVVIDVGYGPSNVDFAPDGTAVWSLPSSPPHALSLVH